MTVFGQVLTAMITPFDSELKIDFNRAQKLAKHLIQTGSDSLVIAGTTGESPTLSHQEKIELFMAVKEAVGRDAKVIAGTGSNDTSSTIELSKEAAKLGLDGLMLVTPYYNKPSQEGLYQHFSKIAKSVDLPIMLYNIPSRTGTNILPSTIARLSAIENIVALKEAAGSLDQVSELMDIVSPNMTIYSGDDSLTLPMLSVGARGIVSVASHLVGQRLQEMITSFFEGNVSHARSIHLELFPLFKGLFITSNPVPVKKALNMTGMPVGGVRLPLVDTSPQETEHLHSILLNLKLI